MCYRLLNDELSAGGFNAFGHQHISYYSIADAGVFKAENPSLEEAVFFLLLTYYFRCEQKKDCIEEYKPRRYVSRQGM